MATLWEKIGGGLLANAGQTALVECDHCPCSSSSSSACCAAGYGDPLFATIEGCAGLAGVIEIGFAGVTGPRWTWSTGTTVTPLPCGNFTARFEVDCDTRLVRFTLICGTTLPVYASDWVPCQDLPLVFTFTWGPPLESCGTCSTCDGETITVTISE